MPEPSPSRSSTSRRATEITRYLAFRGRLRASAALKRSLAPRDRPDVDHYADAKGPLIREILARSGPGNSST